MRNVERMRYKSDSLSSGFCIFSILFDIVYFVMIYSSSTIISDYPTGIDVIINILFMLVVFWAGEQIKVYDLKWAFGAIGLSFVQIARLFWLPEMYNKLGQLTGVPYAVVRLSLIASACCLLAAGLISASNATALRKYLKSSEVKS